jgi:tetratricopeptide (TPR) repeat protein
MNAIVRPLSLTLAGMLLAVPVWLTAQDQPPGSFSQSVGPEASAGMQGDKARLDKALQMVDTALKNKPEFAEALVWKGALTLFQSGQAFMANDFQTAGDLWAGAMDMMDRAVKLEPDNFSVRFVRASVLLPVVRLNVELPTPASELLVRVVADYERSLEVIGPGFSMLPATMQSETLFNLAESYEMQGKSDKARKFYARVVAEYESSAQYRQAKEWLDKHPATN